MARSRICLFVASFSAVVVLAAACGGGGDDNEQASQADPVPDEGPGLAASEGDQHDQRDTESGPVAELDGVQVHLGDRFAWCADVQSAWDTNNDALRAALAAAADYNAAAAAFSASADELDQAAALEQMHALEQHARDIISRYVAHASSDTQPGLMSAFRSEITQLNDGAEGTKGVAYERARDAFEAAASQQDAAVLNVLNEFLAILRASPSDEQRYARLRALPMPPALEASFAITDAEAARNAAPIPTTYTAQKAWDVTEFLLNDTHYTNQIAQDLANSARIAVYAHLLDPDLNRLLEAWAAEAADYESTIRLAHDTAAAAFQAAFAAAEAEQTAADGVFTPDEHENAQREAWNAAEDAARPVIENDLATVKAAGDAVVELDRAAFGAASDETRNAVITLSDESTPWEDLYESQRNAIYDAIRAINVAVRQDIEAARDIAVAAADEAFYADTYQAVAETTRVARAENLASAVIAEAALKPFEFGHAAISSSSSEPTGPTSATSTSADMTPDTFLRFVTTAVAVETLIRSDAWGAIEQSLSQACQ